MKRWLPVPLLLLLAVVIWLWLPSHDGSDTGGEPFSVTGALSGEDVAEGYPRVTGPEALDFPRDHGAHPEYRNEWWYVTGNLEDADGNHYGYQITFFRFNVDPNAPQRESALATNQVWMAHLALTDSGSGRFHHEERLSRGASGLAGASAQPFAVWLDDWRLDGDGDDFMPLRLRAAMDGVTVDLRLDAAKPMVLQGEQGYSQKGRKPGNASRYFSYTRLLTEGSITVEGERLAVAGTSWMDREWGTSPLEEEQTGWDWFSIQLDNEREIMFYHLRRADGSIDAMSKGLLVESDGSSRVLTLDEVELTATRHWESPLGDARYPVAWQMRIPGEGIDLTMAARMDDQELRTGFRYWEGAIAIDGEDNGESITGVGYAELTGYVR